MSTHRINVPRHDVSKMVVEVLAALFLAAFASPKSGCSIATQTQTRGSSCYAAPWDVRPCLGAVPCCSAPSPCMGSCACASSSLNAPIMRYCAAPSGRTGVGDPAQQTTSLPSRVRLSPPYMAEAAISPIWCRSLRAASVYPGSSHPVIWLPDLAVPPLALSLLQIGGAMSQAISVPGDRRPLRLPPGIPVPLIAGILVAGAAIARAVIEVISMASGALVDPLPALLLYNGLGVVSGGLLIVAAWHPGLLRSAVNCLAAVQMVLSLWVCLELLVLIRQVLSRDRLGSAWVALLLPSLLSLVADLPLLFLALLRWGRTGEIVWKVVAALLAVSSLVISWHGVLLSLIFSGQGMLPIFQALAAMVTWAGVLIVVFALSASPTRRYYQPPSNAIVVWPDHSTTALPVVALAGETSRVNLAQPYVAGYPSDQSVPSDAHLPVADQSYIGGHPAARRAVASPAPPAEVPVAVQTPDVNPALPLAGPSIPASPAGGRRQTPSTADVTRYGRPT